MFRIFVYSRLSRLSLPTSKVRFKVAKQIMASSTWSYDDVNDWKNLPGCKADGNQQSPIDIVEKDVVNEPGHLKPIKLNSQWYSDINGSIVNTGTSLRFDIANDLSLCAETNTGLYQLVQFHFHWGPCAGRGSEHTVNGTSRDSELHFVLANQEKTKNDFCVLGVLLQGDPTLPADDKAWQIFSSPPKCNQTVDVRNYPVSRLLPSSLNYWYYNGSLTTPPCSEVVNWYVIQDALPMPAQVLEDWRKMERDSAGTPLVSNYREVQSLNGRKISSFTQ